MHCLLEGLAHAHFREFLGLTADSAHCKADPIPAFDHLFLNVELNKPQDFSEKDIRVVKSIHGLLTEAVPNLEGNDAQLIEDHISNLERKLLSKKVSCLRFVSVGLGIGPGVTHPGKKYTKPTGLDLLSLGSHRTEPFTPGSSTLCITTPEVMQRITDVIRTADTPSSLRSVPYNFGETKAGTIKADEWCTLTTVYLPIVLVSLWGEGSTHRNSEIAANCHAILDHTMALISAVHITLLPHAPHRTNGHMALHMWDYLQLFGPVRSWWCFPYERLIGSCSDCPAIIFLVSKNQLSSTHISRLRSSNTGSTDLLVLPLFRDVKALFDRFVSPLIDTNDLREDRKTSPISANATPEDLRKLIHVRRVVLHARTLYGGSIYTRYSTHVGNSLILYYPSGARNMQRTPGIIKYIFEMEQGVRFAVQRHLPLDSHPDLFRHYPHFPACLYSSALAENLEIVMPEWVVSHFMRWNFSARHIVVVSLCLVHPSP
ncbi:uncharacterized protein F5147DRAFT_785098 [Suillus discolor]|uniref:Uncharacterized protein n=1 Tax=Suillus discolor TaxID=1912936 RepID=A0A9P7JKW6_9AGAM|nr:uncharacterized protein F5147DRAFT_785098 [Suillus discolor]KAG2079398.1 hypothetical protein F5147DRAFT_785098 [Suillus discolor]